MSEVILEPPVQPTTASPTITEVKAKMKATWEDGDYASFAEYMEKGAIEILENWKLDTQHSVLDIGCGSGQSAIPAARLGHKVVGIDIAENLIDIANDRAKLEGLDAQFDVGDAENLPYDDNSFDVVISMIGAMFAPNPEKVAAEMARVLKPGGKLYMANWTPRGMPAQMFKCVAGINPPPPGFISPTLWGDESSVQQRLSENFDNLQMERKYYPQWHYPFGTEGIVELFRTHFGPVKKAFDKLQGDTQASENFWNQLHEIYKNNSVTHTNGTSTITGGEYLEISAVKLSDV